MGNYIPSPFDFNNISYSDIFSTYFIFIMKCCIRYNNPANIYWFNFYIIINSLYNSKCVFFCVIPFNCVFAFTLLILLHNFKNSGKQEISGARRVVFCELDGRGLKLVEQRQIGRVP